jgi:hypothetical protein
MQHRQRRRRAGAAAETLALKADSESIERAFKDRLKRVTANTDAAISTFCVLRAMSMTSKRHKHIIQRMNEQPRFWITIDDALLTSCVVALGRLFDRDVRSAGVLQTVGFAQVNASVIFSKAALEARKMASMGSENRKMVADFMASVREPPMASEFDFLLAEVERHAKLFDDHVQPWRHKVIAHSDVVKLEHAGMPYRIIYQLLAFSRGLSRSLFQVLWNGEGLPSGRGWYSRDRVQIAKVLRQYPLSTPGKYQSSLNDDAVLETRDVLYRLAPRG